jgi:chromosome segregation protein
MADIIFAGSESRRSLGFAEATLTFDNSSGLLPIDVTEVEVSRRLYRSGESEYLLNRKPCRLRDIRELFMDTGIGVDAYSLIEQGKVDVLLQSNPQERRIIFEEAAGVSKYKAKRREAERKLERTQQNLVRLGDILDEVEKRLRSVKYQAGKARNFLQYTERLKELRVSYALSQYHEQATALEAHESALRDLGDARAREAGALAALEEERSRLETELMELDGEVRRTDARLSEIRSSIATGENEIGFHRTRVGELEQIVERDRRKIGDLSAHLREIQALVESRRRDLAEVADLAARQETAVADIEKRLQETADGVRTLTGRIEHAKAGLMDLAQQKSQRASRLASLDLRLENLSAQADRLAKRRDEIAAHLERLREREEELKAEASRLEATVAERRRGLEAKRHEAEAKQKEVESVGEQLARAKERASALASRRELLEDLEKRGEGIPAAVRRVRETIQTNGHAGRWRGMVADLIEVDVAHAVLIESALGPAEKLLIAERLDDVLALARDLAGTLPGQVRFLALDAIEPATLAPFEPAAGAAGHAPRHGPCEVRSGKDLAAYPEAVGWAMQYVRVDESVLPAVAHLLGRTVVVRSLEGAVALARGPLRGYRFVSLTGDVLEADGSVAVGPPGPETSLISRRSELRNIAAEQESAARQIEALDARRRRAVEELQALDVEQQALRQEIYEASMARVEVEGHQRRLAETRQELSAEAPLVESELADLGAERERLLGERTALAEEITGLDRQAADQQRSIDALVAEQGTLLEARTALEEERTAARVALARLREKHTALVDQVASSERDAAATAQGIEQSQADLAECQTRIRDSQRTMLAIQSDLARLFLEKQAAEAEGRRLAEAGADRRGRVAALGEKERGIEAEIERLQGEIHGRELARRELQTKRDDLVERVRDDFQMDLAERYAQWQPEEVDWDAVAAEIKDLQGKIDRLGPVNLEALQEQEALEKRAEFLQKQRDDLVSAQTALANLIERINRESRERFMTTFQAVRGHFQELYRKLFGGGKADVFLEDETDVLESGIEIVARPPGKQLQRISLLSGGEKAMTAVALLLAVFRARPSPFCILDEVDAPLDEANIDRFVSLVREFLDQSQFVIISHSKRTMSIADVLYGVTMEEPGVSRKVSVKFSDLHDQGLLPEEPAEPQPAAEPQETQEPAAVV